MTDADDFSKEPFMPEAYYRGKSGKSFNSGSRNSNTAIGGSARNDDFPIRDTSTGAPHSKIRYGPDQKINSLREYDNKGNPVVQIDLRSRSGRTDHTFPHQHEYHLQSDGSYKRFEDARPFNPNWSGTLPDGIPK